MTTPLHFKTITELAPLLAAKQLSPVEVTRAMLERIDHLDARYRSYATRMDDDALAAAREAEREITAGRHRGPLHGVPIPVKDLCFTKGVRTMGGCKTLADFVPDFDATVVARLRQAGAIILGKLNLTEGAMGGYNPEFAAPRNPWDPGRWTGASSSGSGVAVAAGLCFAALGSDTGGSIRFPAACCSTGLGAEIVKIKLPEFDAFFAAWPVLCTAEAVLAHATTYPSRKDEYGPWFRSWLDIGAKVTGTDYARAHLTRLECNARLHAVLAEVDVIACPTMPAPPFPVTDELLYGPMTAAAGAGVQRYTVPMNYSGAPTLPLPCGFTRDGLPIGIQLVGKHLAEPLLIQVGHAYEQATDWHRRHPDVALG